MNGKIRCDPVQCEGDYSIVCLWHVCIAHALKKGHDHSGGCNRYLILWIDH